MAGIFGKFSVVSASKGVNLRNEKSSKKLGTFGTEFGRKIRKIQGTFVLHLVTRLKYPPPPCRETGAIPLSHFVFSDVADYRLRRNYSKRKFPDNFLCNVIDYTN